MSGDLHCDRAWHPSPFHVPYGGPAEVVEELHGNAGPPTCRLPRALEAADRRPDEFPSLGLQVRKDVGNDAAELRLEDAHPLALLVECLDEVREVPQWD